MSLSDRKEALGEINKLPQVSVRKEALGELTKQLQDYGVIVLSRQEKFKAIQELRASRMQDEKSRKVLLFHDLAGFYRLAIFGSARLPEDCDEFKFVTKLAQAVVEAKDIDIVTGGGQGIMKAGNLGLMLAKKNPERKRKYRARSFGLTMTSLPNGEEPSKLLHIESKNREFYTRLQDFLDRTRAAFIAPGGDGTLLELAYTMQNIQVEHLEDDYPLIIDPYWEPMINAFYNAAYYQRRDEGKLTLIGEKDLSMIRFTNKIPEIVDTISQHYDNWDQNIRKFVKVLP